MLVPYTPGIFNKGYVPASKALAIINLGAFIVVSALPEKVSLALSIFPGEWNSWRLLTYQFMHAGIWHLVGNLAFLLAFGPVVEEKLGAAKMVLVYLFGGVAAGWAWMALETVYAPLIGASGSISALTGASMVLRPHIPMNGIIWIFIIIFRVSFPVWVWALYFFIMDYLNFFGGFFSRSNEVSGVAYSAHLGGFVSAFIAMFLLRWWGFIKPASSDLVSQFSKTKQSLTDFKPAPKAPAQESLSWTQPSSLSEILKKLESGEEFPIEKLLTLSYVSREQGEGVKAYQMLQLWLERHQAHESSAKVAYELGILCLRHLGRHDLAEEWFQDALKRNPDDQLRQRTETALAVL